MLINPQEERLIRREMLQVMHPMAKLVSITEHPYEENRLYQHEDALYRVILVRVKNAIHVDVSVMLNRSKVLV